MRNISKILIVVFLLFSGLQYANAAEWQYPVIKEFGPVFPIPNAAVQPNKDMEYKILFDISRKAANDNDVNPGLDHVARLINVFATGGVMPDKMRLVVIIHGPATPIALNNDAFKERYGTDNPNLNLLSALKKNGVLLYVCGQSMADYDYDESWIDPNITIALSSLTVVPTFQLMGYALMPW
jgi:intracellular sulfur oxidation DsrE/DsrF family protein